MALRVVSLPATTSRMKKLASSARVSRSPSTSALTRMLVRSPLSTPTLDSATSSISWVKAPPAVRMAVMRSPKSGTYSSSPAPRITFDWSNTKSYWDAGIPIRSHTMRSGSRAATSVTKSHSPRSHTWSTISLAWS